MHNIEILIIWVFGGTYSGDARITMMHNFLYDASKRTISECAGSSAREPLLPTPGEQDILIFLLFCFLYESLF